jgi:hypothetical protein
VVVGQGSRILVTSGKVEDDPYLGTAGARRTICHFRRFSQVDGACKERQLVESDKL